MDEIINQLISNFDFAYMLSVNVLTYILIKVCDYLNGAKKVSVLLKRTLLVIAIVAVAAIYKISGYENNIVLANSAIISPIAWSWILKPVIKKMGIGYAERIED